MIDVLDLNRGGGREERNARTGDRRWRPCAADDRRGDEGPDLVDGLRIGQVPQHRGTAFDQHVREPSRAEFHEQFPQSLAVIR